jgi:hypothetical protein
MSSPAGAIDLVRPRNCEPDVYRHLLATISFTLLLLFVVSAFWLTVRRLSGAFSQPLSGGGIVAVAVVIELAAQSVRRILTRTGYPLVGTQYLPLIGALGGVLALASLSLPGTPLLALIIAWLVFLASEVMSWLPYARPYLNRIVRRQLTTVAPAHVEATDESEIPAGLIQQLTRVRESDRESIHVLASAEIPAEDRLGIVHISFCPPLTSRPELTVHAVDADDVEVRLTQAEIFGARVEVRVPRTETESRQILIEVLGSATARESA